MKKWYTSRSIWTSAFAFVAAIMQAKYGWVFPPETEMAFFAGVQFVLRFFTNEPITIV